MNQCPCCTDKLLRQIERTGVSWFCPYCRQEMPVLNRNINIYKSLATISSKTRS